MAAAMAAWGVGAHFIADSILRDSEKPICSAPILKAPSGFAAAKSFCILRKERFSSSKTIIIPRATPVTDTEIGSQGETGSGTIPTPIVLIDQDSDPDATVAEMTFGDRLGALLDTMNALKNLGLNVVKANVFLDSSGKHNKFSITKADTGRKVEEPELLEAFRLTIINNMIQFHPESSAWLAMGAAFGLMPPKERVDGDIATRIIISNDGPDRSGSMWRQLIGLDYL